MESQQIAVRHGRTGPEMKRNANARNGRLDGRSREKTGSSRVSRMKILFAVRPFLIGRDFRMRVSPSGLDRRSLAFPRPSSRKSQPTFIDGTTAVGRIPSLRSPFHHRFIPNTSPRLLSRYPCRLDLYRNPLLPGPGGREGEHRSWGVAFRDEVHAKVDPDSLATYRQISPRRRSFGGCSTSHTTHRLSTNLPRRNPPPAPRALRFGILR